MNYLLKMSETKTNKCDVSIIYQCGIVHFTLYGEPEKDNWEMCKYYEPDSDDTVTCCYLEGGLCENSEVNAEAFKLTFPDF